MPQDNFQPEASSSSSVGTSPNSTATHNPPKDNTRDFGGGLVTSDYTLVEEFNKGKLNAFFKIDRGGSDYWLHAVLHFAIAGISPVPQAGG